MHRNREFRVDKRVCNAMDLPLALQTAFVSALLCLAAGSPAFTQPQYEWIEAETPASFNLSGILKSPGPGATSKAKIVINYATQEDHYA
ncbi:MAG: hypothetical protein HY318_17430, partial [Armatimonadetes bacterium]|nr:hypothetical protein [Armatimonadota bacterium]